MTGLLRGDSDAPVGGPAVASADSFRVEELIAHCATDPVPLDVLSGHLGHVPLKLTPWDVRWIEIE